MICGCCGEPRPNSQPCGFHAPRVFDTGMPHLHKHMRLFAMQQFVAQGDISDVGHYADHAVHQSRVVIHTDMHLHARIVAVPRLVHLRIMLAVLILGRVGRMMMVTSTMPPWRSGKPRSLRKALLMTFRIRLANSCLPTRRRRLRIVVSSGI